MELNKDNSKNSEHLYKIAAKRVEEIKSFYIHLVVYILVNLMIILVVNDFKITDIRLEIGSFATPFFWGIGLFCHWASVFGPALFFGKNWEEKKIKEIMDKEQQSKQKWE